MSHMHYLPLAPGFFGILVGFFFIVLILRSVRYAYESLGVSSNTAIFLLFATLIGSIFNIPITELPPERVMSHHVVDFFGMRYAVPVVSHWKGTVVAVKFREFPVCREVPSDRLKVPTPPPCPYRPIPF
jgi:uncharacterized membrane protein